MTCVRHAAAHYCQRGFNLLELLFCIAILLAIATMAVPAFSFIIQHNHSTGIVSRLRSDIETTRTLAITHNGIAVLCAKAASSSQQCGSNWQLGTLIYLDRNGNLKLDNNENIISSGDTLPVGSQLQLRIFTNRNFLAFDADGTLRANTAGTLTYCPPDNNAQHAQQLIINRIGRVRLARDKNGDGIAESSKGAALRCPLP